MTDPRPAAADENGWMPIESAPRDGTRVLTFDPGFIGIHLDWFDRQDAVSGWLGEPTHWRPLPPPPAGGGGDG